VFIDNKLSHYDNNSIRKFTNLINYSFISGIIFLNQMGGSKNKSPAQKEKSQKGDADAKKSKKSEKGNTTKTSLSVIMDESKATKYINDAKVITVQDLARQTDTKISVANSFLQKLLNDGAVERIGGFSGHHLYKSVSGK
jgi:small subunit ribosomal protein S25e